MTRDASMLLGNEEGGGLEMEGMRPDGQSPA